MATLVCVHAHPDDEAIATGGTIALAAAAGHRVVLVVATRGELGEPVPGVLGPGEELWRRRVVETSASAELLGAERVEFLGYRDSGMIGEPSNDDPACFWQADLDDAAGRLAAILDEEGADLLTVYDERGGYGHPDHIQVHRVGVRAAELAGLPPERVFLSTINRDALERRRAEAEAAARAAEAAGVEPSAPAVRSAADDWDLTEIGTPEIGITHAIDVRPVLATKRAAMAAHRSQIAPESAFLALADDAFAAVFGTEWYTSAGRPRPAEAPFATDLFAGPGGDGPGPGAGTGPCTGTGRRQS